MFWYGYEWLKLERRVFRRSIFEDYAGVNRLIAEKLQNQSIGSQLCEEKAEFC